MQVQIRDFTEDFIYMTEVQKRKELINVTNRLMSLSGEQFKRGKGR